MFKYNGVDRTKDTLNLLLEIMGHNERTDTFSLDCHMSFATKSIMESKADSDINVMAIPKLDSQRNLARIVEVAYGNRYAILYYPAGDSKSATTRNIMIDIDKVDFDRYDSLINELDRRDILRYTNICTSGGGLHLYIITENDITADEFEKVKEVFAGICERTGLGIDTSIKINSRMRCPFSLNTKYADEDRVVLCIQRAESKIGYTALQRLTKDACNTSEGKPAFEVKQEPYGAYMKSNTLRTHWTNVLEKIIERHNGNRNTGIFNTFLFLIHNGIITNTLEFCQYIEKFKSDTAFKSYSKKDGQFDTSEITGIARNIYRMKKGELEHVDLSQIESVPSFIERGE